MMEGMADAARGAAGDDADQPGSSAARTREELLTLAERATGLGVWDWDLATGGAVWSAEVYRLHGVAPGTPPTEATWLAAIHPEDRPRVGGARRAARAALAEGRALADTFDEMDYRVVLPDGAVRWIATRVRIVHGVDGRAARLVGVAFDVTERKLVDAALREAEARFRAAFEDSGVGTSLTALDGRFLAVNRALCDIVGYEPGELCRMRFQDITHPDDLRVDEAQVTRLLRGEARAYQMEKRYIHRTGKTVWVLLSVALVRGADGAPRYFVSQVQDVDSRKRLEEDLRNLGYRDALTGCYNRRYLSELAESLAQRAAAGEPLTWGCVFVDVDHFKRYNDVHGHQAGDTVLRNVSHFLERHVRSDEAVVRVGGDEFVLLLVGLDAPRTAQVLERLLAAAAHEAPVPLSLGWAAREGDEPLEATIHRADTHLIAVRLAERVAQRTSDRVTGAPGTLAAWRAVGPGPPEPGRMGPMGPDAMESEAMERTDR